MSVVADAFYVGGYWGPRQESVTDCARRLSNFMTMLAGIHPSLASWYEKGMSRQAALAHRVDPSIETVRNLLLAGHARRDDDDRTVMADLGFSVALWNGRAPEVAMRTRCGSWAAVPGLTSNIVVVDLPEAEGDGLALYHRATALGLVHAVVTAWQPSWCTWTSRELLRAQAVQPGEGVVGWSTYVANLDCMRNDRLPPNATVERLEGGLLITLNGDVASGSVESVSAVRSALGTAVSWTSLGAGDSPVE